MAAVIPKPRCTRCTSMPSFLVWKKQKYLRDCLRHLDFGMPDASHSPISSEGYNAMADDDIYPLNVFCLIFFENNCKVKKG